MRALGMIATCGNGHQHQLGVYRDGEYLRRWRCPCCYQADWRLQPYSFNVTRRRCRA